MNCQSVRLEQREAQVSRRESAAEKERRQAEEAVKAKRLLLDRGLEELDRAKQVRLHVAWCA